MRTRLFPTSIFALALAASLTPLCAQGRGGGRGARGSGAAADAQGSGGGAGGGLSSNTVAALRFRSIGPGIISGRVVALAVEPGKPSHYFVAAASGGVWRTTNDGATFTPVFDREASYSIGTVVLDPNNPNTVWVGTGENNSQRTVSYGDGVYRSDDNGSTWRNLGLKNSQHIGKILIDPKDSNTVYVAAQGPLWGSGGDRGLYKTTDGGKTWTNTMTTQVSEHTGVTDAVMDPRNPDIIYAATYQRERHVYSFIDGGPESAIYKTIDAGKTWTRLRGGLPGGDLGRIGLAISPADNGIIYATVEAANRAGGVFRSDDGGVTWQNRNPIQPGAMYYAQIIADPKYADRVYELDTNISVSDDGARTFALLGEPNKHVDNHVLWIDPADNDHYLSGCDGGLYESWDRAATWVWKYNLPLGQFVDVTTDNATPFYNIYGGTQDNNDEGGPSRTFSASGITTSDWYITHGGDGFHNAVDPTDPNITYSESQGGVIDRTNRLTHEVLGIQPQPGANEGGLRWGWDVPFFISPFSHTRLYMGANKLFRTDDRGNSWKEISPDLTRNIDRDSLPMMGRIWGPSAVAKNASTAPFGKITTIDESPKKENLLYVGTDDGVISISEDGGGHWTRDEKFPGVPDQTFVSRIIASQTDPATVYAAFENHKNNDFKPYLLKSTDMGKSWTPIQTGFPDNGSILSLAQDDADPNLMFAGSEFGLFFTQDGGQRWIQMRGIPTVAVRDLAVQRREHDLVVGTFGRGIYVLDDYTPLRHLDADTLAKAGAILPSRPAFEYLETSPYGGRGKADMGAQLYTADNPPTGAVITYWVKDVPNTAQQEMLRREQAAERGNTDFTPYPTPEQIRQQAEEVAPSLSLVVSDASGKPIRILSIPARAGLSRTTWDLHTAGAGGGGGRGGGGAAGGRGAAAGAAAAGGRGGGGGGIVTPPEGGGGGPLVLPGTYQLTMVERFGGKWTTLAGPTPVQVVADKNTPTIAERQAKEEFEAKVAKLQTAVGEAQAYLTEMGTRLTAMRAQVAAWPGASHQSLTDRTEAVQKKYAALEEAFSGGPRGGGGEGPQTPSISSRLQSATGNERGSWSKPAQADVDDYTIASAAFAKVLPQIKSFGETDLPALEKDYTSAGLPIAGRLPVWSGN